MFTCCANSSFEYERNPNSTSATYSAYYTMVAPLQLVYDAACNRLYKST